MHHHRTVPRKGPFAAWAWPVLGIAVLSAVGLAEVHPAHAEQGCVRAFHDALGKIAVARGSQLGTIAQTMREPDPELPSRWHFWDPVVPPAAGDHRIDARGRKIPMQLGDKVCVEEIAVRGGRERCLKWEPTTPELVERLTVAVPLPLPQPSRRERADLAFLNDTVANRGAITAFRPGGRFAWLAERISGDIRGYLTQSMSPGMCAGTGTMVDFYRRQLAPVADRIAFVREIEARSATRLSRALATLAEQARRNGSGQPGVSSVSLTSGQSPAAAGRAGDLPETLEATVDEILSFVAAPPSGPVVATSAGATTQPPLASARAVIDLMRGPEVSALRAVAIEALRAAEARHHARITLKVYDRFAGLIRQTLSEMEIASRQACTCR